MQKVKFVIKDVKASVDNVVISTAMDSIITNNVFTAKGLFKYKDVFVYSITVGRTKYLKLEKIKSKLRCNIFACIK